MGLAVNQWLVGFDSLMWSQNPAIAQLEERMLGSTEA